MAQSIVSHTLSTTLSIPAAPRPRLFTRAFSAVALVVEAISEGLAASRRYDALRARGVPHQIAMTKVFPSGDA